MKLPAMFLVKDKTTPDGYYGIEIWDEEHILSCHMLWNYRNNRPLKERNNIYEYMNNRKMLIELVV